MINTDILQIITHHRSLYNTTFVSNGCPADQYDPNTTLDDTVGTYLTNYTIGIVGCLGVALTYWRFNKHYNNRHDAPSAPVSSCTDNHYYLMGYFGWTAVGYTLAGVGHQLYTTIDDNPGGRDAVFATSLFCVALGAVCAQLELVGATAEATSSSNQTQNDDDADIENNDSITMKKQCNRRYYYCIAVLCIFIGAVLSAIVVGLTERDLVDLIWTISGVYVFSATLAVALGYLMIYRDWGAGLGGLVYATGFIVQVTLESRCGYDAYEDCFVDCPLPVNFNHNALFHVLVVVGMLIQMMFGRYDWHRRSSTEPKIAEAEQASLPVVDSI